MANDLLTIAAVGGLVCNGLVLVAGPTGAQTSGGSLMKVDYESLVSRADLSYNTPVVRSEEGLPIGNGRTGSLVWTTPTALHFQVNHVDLFCMGHNTQTHLPSSE